MRYARMLVWALVACVGPVLGDGKMIPPRNYTGSLEERAQEAIIIFHGGEAAGQATEEIILKVSVQGDLSEFAWVVPFPNPPEIEREDAKLFRELFDYARAGRRRPMKKPGTKADSDQAVPSKGVEVISRKTVGNYDTAVVREHAAGALNQWLTKEGFQPLEGAEDVIGFYREKGYAFACMRVSDAQLVKDRAVELHPLRFSFKTGGRDGIYYPMKMTGLQTAPFDVNLYVFYGAWLNDEINRFGYVHRGFRLTYRDWDTGECTPNAGKSWSAPKMDPLLRGRARLIPTVTRFFQKLHPGERYYLTNIQASRLDPASVRGWSDDLWLFPYYTDKKFVPYDARPGGAAATAWQKRSDVDAPSEPAVQEAAATWEFLGLGVLAAVAAGAGFVVVRRTDR